MIEHVNTNKKITSNGHGSFEQKIVVRVDIGHVEAFKDAFGVEPFRSLPEYSDFIVQTSSTKRGDDETVLYDIDYRLPEGIVSSGWSVLWDESVY
jgi:hypothetical protein